MPTLRRRAPRRGSRTTERLLAGVEAAADLVVVVDPDGRPRWWNTAAGRFFVRAGRPLRVADAIVGGDAQAEPLLAETAAGHPWHGELDLLDQQGDPRPFSVSTVPDAGGGGRAGGFLLVARDVGEQRRATEELARQALHDQLTGLPNRALLEERLDHLSRRLRRSRRHGAVLVLDIDRLQVVNASLGAAQGDQLLRFVADRIQARLRAADTVARTAGDEFTVLVDDLDRPDDARTVAEGVLDELREPFELDDGTVVVSASIGVVHIDADDSPDELLRRANLAMYRAKNRGGARYALYDEHSTHGVDRRLQVEWALRQRLDDARIDVRFEPVVDLRSGAIVFAEGRLVTEWPELGSVGLEELERVADEAGLSPRLARRVAAVATGAASGWPEAMLVSFDVSPRAVVEGRLADDVSSACADAGITCDRVIVEVSEAAFLEEPSLACEALRHVRATGARVALDAFGTGVSSLATLRSLPVDIVKLDQALLGDLAADSTRAIVGAVLGVADVLDLVSVAVGVETDTQLEVARSVGCDLAQGARLGAAVEASALEPWFSAVPAGD